MASNPIEIARGTWHPARSNQASDAVLLAEDTTLSVRLAERIVGREIDQDDKAVVEIEAPVAGIVAKHLFPEGTVVKMGATLTSIRST